MIFKSRAIGYNAFMNEFVGDHLNFNNLGEVRKHALYGLIADCSAIDEEELALVVTELSRRLIQKTTDRDKIFFTLLACSQDHKQRSFGLDMIANFIPREEAEKFWAAVYCFSEPLQGEKNIAKVSATAHIMVAHDISMSTEDIFTGLAHKYGDFLETISQIKNKMVLIKFEENSQKHDLV